MDDAVAGESGSGLAVFLEGLFATGEAGVGPADRGWPVEEDASVVAQLAGADARLRAAAPGESPALDRGAALWAARWLYVASVCLADRRMDDGAVTEALVKPGVPGEPEGTRAADHHAVDLVLRCVPAFDGLLRRHDPGDVLHHALAGVARRWPRAAPGFKGPDAAPVVPDAAPLAVVLGDPALRARYVDRVLGADAAEWLEVPEVAVAVRVALGDHGGLAGPRVRAWHSADAGS